MVALGIARAQPGGGTTDPFAPVRSMADTLKTFNDIRNQNAAFGARNQLGQIIATAPNWETAMDRIQRSPSLAFAPEVLTEARQAYLAQQQGYKVQQDIGQTGMEFWFKHGVPQILADPSSYPEAYRQWRASQPDSPMTTQNAEALEDARTALTANSSSDPAVAASQRQQRGLGMLMGSGASSDMLKWSYGTPDMFTAPDGSTYPIWRGGALGGVYGGAPGGQTFVGPGYSPGVKPGWVQGPGNFPIFTPGAPSQPIAPPGAVMPGAPGAGDGYGPGDVQATPLPPPAAGGAPAPATGAPPAGSGGAPAGTTPPPAATPTSPPPGETAPTAATPAAAPTTGPGGTTTPTAPAPGSVMAPPGTIPQPAVDWRSTAKAALVPKEAEAFDKHYGELSERVDAGRQLLQGIDEMRDLMQRVQTGTQQSWRQPLANLAARIGASQDVVDRIAGGDYAAAQELQKFFVTTTMGQLRGQLPAGSRLNLQEWTTFNRNNPNLETQPDAIERIFNFWTRQYDFNRAELDQYPEYVLRDGGSPYTWGSEWSRRAVAQHFVTGQQETGQARGATPGPAPMAPGAPPPQPGSATPGDVDKIMRKHLGG